MSDAAFEKCLAITLKWEGGYSNHPDDPGGPTMRGIIQREYDKWRRAKGLRTRPVRQIEDSELRTIYRENYWDAMNCGAFPSGVDLVVFDAAVNSGVGRASQWVKDFHHSGDDNPVNAAQEINAYCDARLAFLQRLKTWRVFGAGWRDRVAGVRASALAMAGSSSGENPPAFSGLHAGMVGDSVLALQSKLRALGYPVGDIDGIFGPQTRRAVILFQDDNELDGAPGEWLDAYNSVDAKPALPRRAEVTHKDLEAKGDKPVRRLNGLQRIFGWIFGASVVSGVADSSSVMDSITSAHQALEPLQTAWTWASGHLWIAVALGAVALITLIRLMRSDHVKAYQNFTYQGG